MMDDLHQVIIDWVPGVALGDVSHPHPPFSRDPLVLFTVFKENIELLRSYEDRMVSQYHMLRLDTQLNPTLSIVD